MSEPCDGCRDEVRGIVRHSRMAFLQHFLLGKPLERNGQDSIAVGAARARPLGERAIEWRLGVDTEYADTFLLEVQDGPTLEGSAFARAIRSTRVSEKSRIVMQGQNEAMNFKSNLQGVSCCTQMLFCLRLRHRAL